MPLITWDSQHLAGLNLQPSQEARVEAVINAVSKGITRYLNRELALAEYDKILPINSGRVIFLNSYPVKHVSRLMTGKTSALTVRNTSAQVATIATTSTGLQLLSVTAGVRTNTTITYALNVKLSALATAINAISGWEATVATGYGDYPSSDLVIGQSVKAKTSQQLALWQDTDSSYEVDNARGMIQNFGYQNSWLTGSVYHASARVIWTGGFETVPEDIQMVCGQLVAQEIDQKQGLLSSESLGEYSYSISTENLNRLPVTSKKLLDAYRDRII